MLGHLAIWLGQVRLAILGSVAILLIAGLQFFVGLFEAWHGHLFVTAVLWLNCAAVILVVLGPDVDDGNIDDLLPPEE